MRLQHIFFQQSEKRFLSEEKDYPLQSGASFAFAAVCVSETRFLFSKNKMGIYALVQTLIFLSEELSLFR